MICVPFIYSQNSVWFAEFPLPIILFYTTVHYKISVTASLLFFAIVYDFAFVCILFVTWSFVTSSQLRVLWERSSWCCAVKEREHEKGKCGVTDGMAYNLEPASYQRVLTEQDKSSCMASKLAIGFNWLPL